MELWNWLTGLTPIPPFPVLATGIVVARSLVCMAVAAPVVPPSQWMHDTTAQACAQSNQNGNANIPTCNTHGELLGGEGATPMQRAGRVSVDPGFPRRSVIL